MLDQILPHAVLDFTLSPVFFVSFIWVDITLSAAVIYAFDTMFTGDQGGANKLVKDRSLRSPEAFVSLQLEKTTFRDLMLNEFLEKKRTMAMILKNAEEADKLKRLVTL